MVVKSDGDHKAKDKGEGGSPATKRPRVEGGEADGSPQEKAAAAAHKVEENGNGSAAVPL